MKWNELTGWKKDLLIFSISISPAVIAAVVLYLMGPEVYLPVAAVVSSFYFAVGVGWITSPAIGLTTGIHPVWLILLLVFISTESSLVVSVNYDLLEKIPLLGRGVKAIRKRSQRIIDKYELAKNVEYMTIFWLMFLPVYGTGPMAMSLVGRLLALEKLKVWLTITLSSVTRYTLIIGIMYYGIITIF